MLMIRVGYPSRAEERQIMDLVTESDLSSAISSVASVEDIFAAQKAVREIPIDDKLKDYIVDIICATRNPADYGLGDLQDYIEFGASPRATIFLNLAARAHAFIRREEAVFPEDIKAIAKDVLRHRVVLTYEAEAENLTTTDLIQRLLNELRTP